MTFSEAKGCCYWYWPGNATVKHCRDWYIQYYLSELLSWWGIAFPPELYIPIIIHSEKTEILFLKQFNGNVCAYNPSNICTLQGEAHFPCYHLRLQNPFFICTLCISVPQAYTPEEDIDCAFENLSSRWREEAQKQTARDTVLMCTK